MRDDAVLDRDLGGRHVPFLGRGRDQHRARRGAGLAQLLLGIGDGGRLPPVPWHRDRKQVVVELRRRPARLRRASAPSRRRAPRRRSSRGRYRLPCPISRCFDSTVTVLSGAMRTKAFGGRGRRSAAWRARRESADRRRRCEADGQAGRRRRRRPAGNWRRLDSTIGFDSAGNSICVSSMAQPSIVRAAAWIAARMRTYVAQRQMLPRHRGVDVGVRRLRLLAPAAPPPT